MRRGGEEPSYIREQDLLDRGYSRIAGCDEAGRGPLAGPVVAAAVILPTDLEPHLVHGLRDSKQLTEQQRDHFYRIVIELAVCHGVGTASPKEIDQINILKASLLAMERAVGRLVPKPDYVLVDGNKTPSLRDIPAEAVVGGDRCSFSIAAASIVAKVVRDRIMVSYHERYPQYGFDAHKGYPTEYHRAALEVFGASDIHRYTFSGVAECLLAPAPSPTFERLFKRFAARLTLDRMEDIEKDIEKSRGMSEAERFVLQYRCKHLLEDLKRKAIDLRPSTRERGEAKEELAARYMEKRGYKIWERNF
ncbi:MAG: ribonuclease HII, partial [bacterium]